MKKNKIKASLLRPLLLTLFLTSALTAYLGLAGQRALASIDTKYEACKALNSTAGSGISCKDPDASSDAQDKVNGLISSVTNVLSFLVGGVSVIMLIFGGFKYVTSNGDANQTKNAKDTVMYALIGLLLVGFAQTLVRFVWSNV